MVTRRCNYARLAHSLSVCNAFVCVLMIAQDAQFAGSSYMNVGVCEWDINFEFGSFGSVDLWFASCFI